MLPVPPPPGRRGLRRRPTAAQPADPPAMSQRPAADPDAPAPNAARRLIRRSAPLCRRALLRYALGATNSVAICNATPNLATAALKISKRRLPTALCFFRVR